jgi:hypothetical protein
MRIGSPLATTDGQTRDRSRRYYHGMGDSADEQDGFG